MSVEGDGGLECVESECIVGEGACSGGRVGIGLGEGLSSPMP